MEFVQMSLVKMAARFAESRDKVSEVSKPRAGKYPSLPGQITIPGIARILNRPVH
jgi:hypothetical protein